MKKELRKEEWVGKNEQRKDLGGKKNRMKNTGKKERGKEKE